MKVGKNKHVWISGPWLGQKDKTPASSGAGPSSNPKFLGVFPERTPRHQAAHDLRKVLKNRALPLEALRGLLSARGAAPADASFRKGQTALHALATNASASFQQVEPAFSALLEANPDLDLDAKDNHDVTPMEAALQTMSYAAFFLAAHGAKVNVPMTDGKTPFETAKQNLKEVKGAMQFSNIRSRPPAAVDPQKNPFHDRLERAATVLFALSRASRRQDVKEAETHLDGEDRKMLAAFKRWGLDAARLEKLLAGANGVNANGAAKGMAIETINPATGHAAAAAIMAAEQLIATIKQAAPSAETQAIDFADIKQTLQKLTGQLRG